MGELRKFKGLLGDPCALEIGVLLVDFFKEKNIDDLYLKWPNDLLNGKGEKCGGILCQLIDEQLIVGIGLNFQNEKEQRGDYKFPIGYIDHAFSHDSNFSKNLPAEIYHYILNNRLNKNQVKESWSSKNFFKNKMVTIEDGKRKITGKFIGIGPIGEAVIQDQQSGENHTFVTGSLS